MEYPILTGIAFTYQTLEPCTLEAADCHLSVGTITLLLPEELPLDFYVTLGNCYPQQDQTLRLEVKVCELDEDTFADEYDELDLLPGQFTYDFFSSRQNTITISEVYTEFLHSGTECCIPLTLTKAVFLFSDGSALDFSGRIGVFALDQLAEAA